MTEYYFLNAGQRLLLSITLFFIGLTLTLLVLMEWRSAAALAALWAMIGSLYFIDSVVGDG